MVVEEAIGRHSRINVQSEKPSPAKGTGPSGVPNQGSSSVRSSPRSASPSRLSSVVKQNTEDSTANEEEPSPDVAAPRLREVDLQQVSEKHQREQAPAMMKASLLTKSTSWPMTTGVARTGSGLVKTRYQ